MEAFALSSLGLFSFVRGPENFADIAVSFWRLRDGARRFFCPNSIIRLAFTLLFMDCTTDCVLGWSPPPPASLAFF